MSGSLTTAAASDDPVEALRALRERLALELDVCTSQRELASLSLRFMDVVGRLAEMTGHVAGAPPVEAGKETGLSDFERRLRERESASKAPRSATS